MEERVEAVRQYLFKESTKVRICERLQVSDKSFDVWRKQLEPEIFRRYDYKDLPLYVMKDKKLNKVVPVGESPAEELSRLRRENQLLKVHLEGYEILSRLAHEEYGIDLKKNFGEKSSANNEEKEAREALWQCRYFVPSGATAAKRITRIFAAWKRCITLTIRCLPS